MTEDRDLIKRTLDGERGAFDEIVARYQDGLYRHLLRLDGRPEEAEDLCQEAFIGLYRNLRRFDPERPLIPFLFTIATNAWRKRQRRAGREIELPAESARADGYSVSEQVLSRLEHQQVLAALAQLRPEQREAVSLYYDQGLSYREIATITRVPVGTVSTRLRSALGALRQVLAAGGAGLAIPVGGADLLGYLVPALQGQGGAPASLGPAVAQGIATIIPAGAGLLALWKEAGGMMKAIYVAVGLAVVGGAVVGVPRLMNHSVAAPPMAQVETVKPAANTLDEGLSADMVTARDNHAIASKFYAKGEKTRIEPLVPSAIQIFRPDKKVYWMLYPAHKVYFEFPMSEISLATSPAAFNLDGLARAIGAGGSVAKSLLGQETVNGYVCEKYSIEPENKGFASGPILAWVAKQTGLVVRWEFASRSNHPMRVDLMKFKFGGVPDSLFEIPEGYTLQGGAPGGPDGGEMPAKNSSAAPSEFSADLIMKINDKVMASGLQVKGLKSRMAFDEEGRKSIQIWRRDRHLAWILNPGDKTYTTITLPEDYSGVRETFSLDNIIKTMGGPEAVTKKLLGQEKVNGYLCDKYSLTPIKQGNYAEQVTVWVAKELSLAVRVVGKQGNDMTQNDLKNIQIGKVPDSVFELPEGYQSKAPLRSQSPGSAGK